MSEGTEMNEDGFAEAIAGLVERHPVLCYQMKLEDSHIPLHVVKRDFFGDTFLEVFWQYNNALFDSVRLMIRYEKSLKAWRQIVAGVDDKVLRNTLVMDYVHPVFMAACDLPNVFKDQLVRGCVKLATVAKGDYSYLRDGRPRWFDVMNDVCADTSLGVQLCDIVDGDLFEGADATHFRDLHGSCMHDLSQSLVSGFEQTVSAANCITMQTYIKPFDLGKELEVLDRQRRRIQKAYLLFGDYGDALYEGRSGNWSGGLLREVGMDNAGSGELES